MSDEAIWRMLLEWQDSDEGKRLRRAMDIADEAMRIHEAAMRAMCPVYIITTDNTRPVGKRTKAGGR